MGYNNIEQHEENIRRAEKSVKRERKIYERNQEIARCFRVVFFTPLSIAFNVISIVAKLIGSIASIGMPYGVYCIYKVYISLKGGMAFSQIHSMMFVWLFIALPVAAFLIHFIADKLHHYFFRNSI